MKEWLKENKMVFLMLWSMFFTAYGIALTISSVITVCTIVIIPLQVCINLVIGMLLTIAYVPLTDKLLDKGLYPR